MPEQKTEVKTYKVDYLCDVPDCGGSMRPTGQQLLSYPAQYPHVCNKCRAEKTFRGVTYPNIVHE